MTGDVFEYRSYKSYLNDWLDDPKRGGGYGSRAKLAQAISCQTSYVAQVLNGAAHFSLEQIEAANTFMGHGEVEGLYLITLAQFERSGSAKLKQRFEKQLQAIQESRRDLKTRLGIKQPLSSEDRNVYYSAWYYAAIHVMASQARFSTSKAIAAYLELDSATVNLVLQFLMSAGLIEKRPGGYKVGKTTIHLSSDSPLISKHHINWRLQAIRSLEKNFKNDLHYSSVNTLSKRDVAKVREILTKSLEQSQVIIKASPEEEVQCLAIDFFKI